MPYLDEFEGQRPPVLTPNPTHRPLLTADQKVLTAGQVPSNVVMPKPPPPPTVDSTVAHLRSLTAAARQTALHRLRHENPTLHKAVEAVLRRNVSSPTPPQRSASVVPPATGPVVLGSISATPQQVHGPWLPEPLPDTHVDAAGQTESDVSPEELVRKQQAARAEKLRIKREMAGGMLHAVVPPSPTRR